MRKGSIKNTRINSEVQKELSNIIHNELKDPRIHPMTSVTSCEVTPDLKLCKVFVSVMSDDQGRKETLEGLRKAAPFMRRALAATVNLRNTPELKFILDESIEYGIYMDKLIESVHVADESDLEEEIDEDDIDEDIDEEDVEEEDDEESDENR